MSRHAARALPSTPRILATIAWAALVAGFGALYGGLCEFFLAIRDEWRFLLQVACISTLGASFVAALVWLQFTIGGGR